MMGERAAYRKDTTTERVRFEHRHLATIAGVIREAPPEIRRKTAVHFAAELVRTNPRFEISRFLRACGVE